jgi:hypothetical protein
MFDRFAFQKKPIAAVLLLLALIVLVACSDSGDDADSPTSTDGPPSVEEQAYLDEILEIDTLIGVVVVSVEGALEGSYATRGRLFDLVGNQEVYDVYEMMVDRLADVDVPVRYEADHERYLESLNESVLLAVTRKAPGRCISLVLRGRPTLGCDAWMFDGGCASRWSVWRGVKKRLPPVPS